MFLIIVVNLVLLYLIVRAIRGRLSNGALKKHFWAALSIKVLMGIALGLIYKYYYRMEGDTFYLYNLSAYLSGLALKDPIAYSRILFLNEFTAESQTIFFVWNQPRAMFFIKLLSVINIFTFNNYWLTSVYLSLFAFAGTWKLANVLIEDLRINATAVACSFLYLPSFVFWSSGVLKESVMVGAIMFLVYHTVKAAKGKKLGFIGLASCSLLLLVLLLLKYYYFAFLVPVLIAYLLSVRVGHFPMFNTTLRRNLFFLMVFALVCLAGTLLHPNLDMGAFPKALEENYKVTMAASKEKDLLYPNLDGTWSGILKSAPEALIAGLFRPFLWESDLNLQAFAGLENFLLLVFFITAMLYWFYKGKVGFLQHHLAVSTFIVLLAVFLPLASPNFGSLMRYKAGFLPFLVLFVLADNPVFYYFFNIRMASRADARKKAKEVVG